MAAAQQQDQKMHQLLSAVGFTPEHIADLHALFSERCGGSPLLNMPKFCALLGERGIPLDDAQRYFMACDEEQAGSIDFRKFLLIMAAIDPAGSPSASWSEAHARLIFRVFDTNKQGVLSPDDLASLLKTIKSEVGALDSAVDGMKTQTSISEEDFCKKLSNLQITGTDKLIKLRSSVFTALDQQPHCLANDKRIMCRYNATSGAWIFRVNKGMLAAGRLHVLQVWLGKELKRRAQFAGERNLVVSVITDGNQSDFLMTDLNSGLTWDLTNTPFTLNDAMSITVLEPPSMRGSRGKDSGLPAASQSQVYTRQPSLSASPSGGESKEGAAMSRWKLSSHSVVFSRESGRRTDNPSLSSLRAFSCASSEMSHSASAKNEVIVENRRDIRDALDSLEDLHKNGYRWMSPQRLNRVANILIELCAQCRELVRCEPRLVHVPQPAYIIGDLHGNFQDLMAFENALWRMGPSLSPATLLFLGDYVDRRPFGFEVVLYLVVHKICSPSKVVLLRGNHETREQNSKDGFQTECLEKFGADLGIRVWEAVNDMFDHLPIAAVVGGGIFCVHGGIPGPNWCQIPIAEAMCTIPCPLREYATNELATDLMWSDPMETDVTPDAMYIPNTDRCVSVKFSTNALQDFLRRNSLQFVIRAHQYQVHLGFKVQKRNQLITVFSSSAYQNLKNQSSLVYAGDSKIRIMTIDSIADKM